MLMLFGSVGQVGVYKSVFYVGNTSVSGSPNVLGAFAGTGILLWAAASKEPPVSLAATAEASPAASPLFFVFEAPPRFLTSTKKTLFDGAEIFRGGRRYPGATPHEISAKSVQRFRRYDR